MPEVTPHAVYILETIFSQINGQPNCQGDWKMYVSTLVLMSTKCILHWLFEITILIIKIVFGSLGKYKWL